MNTATRGRDECLDQVATRTLERTDSSAYRISAPGGGLVRGAGYIQLVRDARVGNMLVYI